jgi:hypothetical protein
MTPVERALFRDESAHCVAAFAMGGGVIALTLHPWERPELQSRARFEHVRVLSVDDSYADTDTLPPWDIIGFDSEPLTADRWRYCLHTNAVEFCFEAGWPAVERAG